MNPERQYTYRCNNCLNEFTYDEPGEPMCTGPGQLDSHPPVVMWRIRVKDRDRTKEVAPEEGKRRSQGTLLTAEALVKLKKRVKGKLWIPKDGINPWTGEEMTPDGD